ncbi:MAG TPA: sorbosone dehydrogenase family protein [Blastocatellia bacterium]|nr:sorbosone dehydrogenase family protein [Blastocatellia bacterium]
MCRVSTLVARRMTALIMALHLLILIACGQTRKPAAEQNGKNTSNSSLGHYEIKPDSLPPPNATRSAVNPPKVAPMPESARLTLPAGFEIATYAEGNLEEPRWLALAPNGDVFVAESRAGRITILRDANKDGAPEERLVFATGLTQPFGMAFWRDYFYVANTDSVVRFKYRSGQSKAEGEPEKIADLPGKGYRQHWTRNVIFSPDGSKMYVSVGSESNVNVEPDPRRAAISEYNPDGTNHRIFAAGLRNPVGMAFYPGTRTLWTTVNERDGLGDDLVPDYATAVKDGGFYGWPYSYIGRNKDPRRTEGRDDLVSRTIVPDVLIQAHSAALGIAFYDGKMFPREYQGTGFVALRGSWNRSKRTGYKIIQIRFNNGRPAGGYDDFITGWSPDENGNEIYGRPVGLLVLKDGSMLITDDGANKIWRVTYKNRK